ncbi:MAG: helix-turn-helix domain-containing protein, partial [Bacteroidetes bacterium]|nr:helix-turn-helix domain-containing protein [Bacteroidota bacterium]
MNTDNFHISLYNLAFLGTIFIGLNFALQLWFIKRINQAANRFLALALIVIVLRLIHILAIDIRMPLQFLLALGPLIYFYVLKITRPEYKFNRKGLLHFVPALAGQFILSDPALQLLTFISVITYLYHTQQLIERFYRRLKFIAGDRYRYELRWLHKLFRGFSLLWLMWLPYTIALCFYYHGLNGQTYYIFYLAVAVMVIWIAAVALSKSETTLPAPTPAVPKWPPATALKQKAAWLMKAMEVNLFYRDPELTLSSLAEKLNLSVHELSRIINTALKKNFHDFISEYRVGHVIQKMQDPACNHLTLLGIAYDSGFNSKSAFNRVFKEMTGKSPAEYKLDLKKGLPVYKLGRHARFAAVISDHETLPKWSHERSNRNFMFKNYLKIARRNLSRNKASSLINIGGLAVGLACSLLILLWVQNEYAMDAWHRNEARIYTLYERVYIGHKASAGYGTAALIADEMKKVIPEVQYATQFDWGTKNTFQVGEKIAKLNGHFASADYFKVFGNKLLQGNAQTALNTPSSVSISRKMAVQ